MIECAMSMSRASSSERLARNLLTKYYTNIQTENYDFCCIVYPWELYLMEFDLYFLAKPKYETYKSAIGYCVVDITHMEVLRDITLDNDYNKIMNLYIQDYPMT